MWDDYGSDGIPPSDFGWHEDIYDPEFALAFDDESYQYDYALANILRTSDVIVDIEFALENPDLSVRGHRFSSLSDAVNYLSAIGVLHLASIVRVKENEEDETYSVAIVRDTGRRAK